MQTNIPAPHTKSRIKRGRFGYVWVSRPRGTKSAMALSVTVPLTDLSDRALLILIAERQLTMNSELEGLQAAMAALTAAIATVKTGLDANAALATTAIAKLEELAALIAGLQVDSASIAQLKLDAQAALAEVQADAAEVAATNASVQAELDKLATPPAPTT